MNPEDISLASARRETIAGVLYAGVAFLIWGLSPVYWQRQRQRQECNVNHQPTDHAQILTETDFADGQAWKGYDKNYPVFDVLQEV